MLQLIQQVILLIGTSTGALTDARTGYIYDWITYPMIITGIILSIMQQQWNNIIVGAIIFGLFFLAYKFGKIGGGDVKIFLGIALLNPTNNPLFLFGAMFIAAMSAIVFYSVYYTLKYARKGIKLEENLAQIKKAVLFGGISVIYFGFLAGSGLLKLESIFLLGFPLMLGFVFFALQEGIKKNFFEKKIKINKIEEDEIVSEKNSNKVLKILNGKLIGPKEINLLKKNKITEIIVLRNLPKFGPFILVGVIAALIAPELMTVLFF
jgi:Flp pilus assembly protein protease CpaA